MTLAQCLAPELQTHEVPEHFILQSPHPTAASSLSLEHQSAVHPSASLSAVYLLSR